MYSPAMRPCVFRTATQSRRRLIRVDDTARHHPHRLFLKTPAGRELSYAGRALVLGAARLAPAGPPRTADLVSRLYRHHREISRAERGTARVSPVDHHIKAF